MQVACLTAECNQLRLPLLCRTIAPRCKVESAKIQHSSWSASSIPCSQTATGALASTNAAGRHLLKQFHIAFRLQPMQFDGHIGSASCRLHLGALSAGIAHSRRAAASVCNWALQPVDVAVGLRVSRMGVCSRHWMLCTVAHNVLGAVQYLREVNAHCSLC